MKKRLSCNPLSLAIRRHWATAPAAFLSTLLALPVNAGIVVPDQPLDTGVRVAPNILFILDDSGSMAWENINNGSVSAITGAGDFNDGPSAGGVFDGNTGDLSRQSGDSWMYEQSYATNTMYYNPATTYEPWMTASGNRVTGGVTYKSAYNDTNYVTYTDPSTSKAISSGTTDLTDVTRTFYTPKDVTQTGAAYLKQVGNYYRYQILAGGNKIIRAEYGKVVISNIPVAVTPSTGQVNGTNSKTHMLDAVPAGVKLKIYIKSTERTTLFKVYSPSGALVCDDSVNEDNTKTCTVNSTESGAYKVVTKRWNNSSSFTKYQISATYEDSNSCDGGSNGSYGWINCTAATPTGRSVDDETANFATWYSFYRTRIKSAKGGAAEAFKSQGKKVRVGFRTIWDRGNSDIPVKDGNDGRFVNGKTADGDQANTTSRSAWYNALFAAYASNGTPLQSALNKAGAYFMGSADTGPYGPENGSNQFSCRQNFTILTTDGYWNSSVVNTGGGGDGSAGTLITNGLSAGDPKYKGYQYKKPAPYADSYGNTLADVAMYYWKQDLRTDLDNNVPSNYSTVAAENDEVGRDPAFWQHMVTFTVSIGLKTTSGLSSVSDVTPSTTWPDPDTGNAGNDNPYRLDDLLHAAVNGRGNFVSASNPQAFADGLRAALASIAQRTSSSSNVATNAATVKTGGKIFNASYVSGIWTGAVNAWNLDANNNPSSLAWTASIPAFSTRKAKVYTYNGSTGASFPTGTQTTALDRSGVGPVDYPVTGAENADYIMGDQSKEGSTLGKLRIRDTTVLGDIVDSSPTYVEDTKTLYVGANDGMLHAFDATNGQEQFAYVPNIQNFAKLSLISRGDYDHQWSVDGPVVVTTRKQTPSENWLVGALGRGGKGLYGLDVSAPGSFGTASVKWELADTAGSNMGLVTGRPILTKVKTGDMAAVLGNGVNSTNDKAVLIVVNVKTGAVIREIDTGAGSAGTPNGLSAPTGILGPDGKTMAYAYAGDRLGNVWKFDLTGASASSWTATKLFTAKSADGTGTAQPITGSVTVATDPKTFKRWVLFGTGSYMTMGEAADKSTNTQGMYGIMDDGSSVPYSDLVKRSIGNTGATQDGYPVRTFDAKGDLPSGKRGWYLNLPGKGERIVQDAQMVSNVLITASMIPEGSGCEAGGTGYINALDAFTGTSAGSSFFDLDGDGDTKDSSVGGVPVGSVNFGVGMPTLPIFLDGKLVVGGTNAGNKPGSGGIKMKTWSRVSWREIRSD